MINASHKPLNQSALLAGFIVLLFVPLFVALFSDLRCPPDRGETVNVPRYVNNAARIAFNCYDGDTRILISIPEDWATYLGRYHVTREDLIEGIKEVKTTRPADAGIVYLKAGVGVSYGSVVEVLQTVRAAGIDRVGLVVLKAKPSDDGNHSGFLEVRVSQPSNWTTRR